MTAQFVILVAEDDPDDVLLLKRAFARTGVEASIRYVQDGQEVLDYLVGKPPFDNPVENPLPHLLLLDLKMPRMDGFEVLQWLHRQPFLHRLPVVVFSASGEPEDLRRAYELGASSYLVKPRTVEQFMDAVQTVKKYWFDLNALPPRDYSGARRT